MSDPLEKLSVPEFKLNITSQPVTAKPRKMKTRWSLAAAQDLRDLWSPQWPRRPDNTLDILRDALEDHNYDPDAPEPYKGLWRHKDGRVASPEEVKKAFQGSEVGLVESMAAEMTAEIDREILNDLNLT